MLAVEWNGDEMSALNAMGLLVCLSGIVSHVIHKLRTTTNAPRTDQYYEEREGMEMGTPLISNSVELARESSEDEHSDTQELFNVLRSHDR